MYNSKSLSDKYWKIYDSDERLILSYSQKNNISPILSKLLILRNIDDEYVSSFLNPSINKNVPNPYLLKDMDKSVIRTLNALMNNEKIGIISDYDVDGSTSAAILYRFIKNFSNNIVLRTPNRLSEGYGPNLKIMDEMRNQNIKLLFTLDCGTSSFDIIDNKKYSKIDVIVIDHHLSDSVLPKVFSIINPNRMDENNNFSQMAAVGVTFLFLLALRKTLRKNNFFTQKIKEPNLLDYLDLVALGTVCDVVNLIDYNRLFVKEGLDIIKKRKNIGISKIIDNSSIRSTPNSSDLGFILGPQLNAASRIDDSSLASKILISDDILEIDNISKKLILLNEKRKLIEKIVFEDALKQAEKQKNQNYILVYGDNWHNGVLGIVASKLVNKFYKPAIVISFINKIGIGSARSIKNVDLGKIILNAKNNNILTGGGGHIMAAGLQINFDQLQNFSNFLVDNTSIFSKDIFNRIDYYDSEISLNEINSDLLDIIEIMEPFGQGNSEPLFVVKDLKIESIKILKQKHILIFLKNGFDINIKAICFNCIDTILGDYLLNFNKYKFALGCSIRRDNFGKHEQPQLVLKDLMIID